MNKKERVKLVFETISKIAGFEIKPDKDFYMVEYGIKYTYKIDENLNIFYKTATGEYKKSSFNITIFFYTLSQLEEIEEPLLTDDEKEFLRPFKFDSLEKDNYLYMYDKNNVVDNIIILDCTGLSFDGLKVNRKYSREELGL